MAARYVTGALRSERAPVTIESTQRVSILSWLFHKFVLFTSRYRVELGYLFGLYVVLSLLSEIHRVLVPTSLISLILWFAYHGPSRQFLLHTLSQRKFFRTFDDACRHGGLVTWSDHTPKVVRGSYSSTPAGKRFVVRIPSGLTASDVERSCESLATHLEAREVRVERNSSNARFCTIDIVFCSPLGESSSLAWPNLSSRRLSMWDAIPVGIDEYGKRVSVSLVEQSLLVGGLPGGGKSVSVSQIVAQAALDPSCRLSLLDGKQVELAIWKDCADHFGGSSVQDAIDVLNTLRSDMDARYEALLSTGKRKVEPGCGMSLRVVVCDELAYYLTMGTRDEVKEFTFAFRDLVARGRAAGIIVIAATQKPSSDIIPTSLRDLFGMRWALRCTTPQSSDSILGQGWASEGYSASSIDASWRGVGYLLHESGTPELIKSFYLSDEDLRDLTRRARQLRGVDDLDLSVVRDNQVNDAA